MLLLVLPPHITHGGPTSSERVFRILRDVTGAYHPEHEHKHHHHETPIETNDVRGQHQFSQFELPNGQLSAENLNLISKAGGSVVASRVSSIISDAVANAEAQSSATAVAQGGSTGNIYVLPCSACPPAGDGHGGYGYPPPPDPNATPHCGCTLKGQCLGDHAVFTKELLTIKTINLVCGLEFEVCCPRDPWRGTEVSFFRESAMVCFVFVSGFFYMVLHFCRINSPTYYLVLQKSFVFENMEHRHWM